MNIFVTGGAGYIGSHFVRMAQEKGHNLFVLDSLESGHPEAIPNIPLFKGNVGDRTLLKEIFQSNNVDVVVHFAGFIQAGESVTNPQKYFNNNLENSTTLLQEMVAANVKHIIFSSTAAVYGDPVKIPIPEDHPTLPTNPYGLSKLFFEETLSYFDRKYGIKFITLRYFNASGAESTGDFGEAHVPESHIIPLAIKAAQENTEFNIFGNDYETPDGTCIRDYIHLDDLVSAHILTAEALISGHKSDRYNVGTGIGYSNLEVLRQIEKSSGKEIKIDFKPRREGDPPQLIADSQCLSKEFGWKAASSSLENIINTSLKWHSTHPKGYASGLA